MHSKLFWGFVFVLLFLIYSFFQRKNNNPPIYYVRRIPFGFNGLVIPPFGVFIRHEHRHSDGLRLHELVHWKQYQREGLFKFLYNYSKASGEFGYDANPYEIEARYLETDFCKSNYTYCVRNGMASTVHNPSFRNERQ